MLWEKFGRSTEDARRIVFADILQLYGEAIKNGMIKELHLAYNENWQSTQYDSVWY
jgi:hypothetical protein